MKNKKILIIAIFIFALLLILSNQVKAEVLDNSNITVSTSLYSSDRSILVKLSGLTLNGEHVYEFGLTANKNIEPTTWHLINDNTETTATFALTASSNDIVSVLKVTDTGYLFIRDTNNENEIIVSALSTNLKLSYLDALNIQFENTDKEYYRWDLSIDEVYGNMDASYQLIKITDQAIIDAYDKMQSEKKELNSISNLLATEVPQSGWINMSNYSALGYSRKISFIPESTENGLYYVWVQAYGDNRKNIYGYTLLKMDDKKPTVTSIAVTSPDSGTYETSQTVKITVTFSEEITGTTVPTLKIRFGESEEREVTNGTIKGKTIVYSYNIVDSDKGQLAVTGYTGGTIKDAAGNDAEISSKTVSGNTIKANVDGTTTNNTQNQDQTNNNQNQDDNKNNNNDQDTDKDNVTTPDTTPDQGTQDKEDTTTAPDTKLPQTGESIVVIATIIAVCGIMAVLFVKNRKYRDIK